MFVHLPRLTRLLSPSTNTHCDWLSIVVQVVRCFDNEKVLHVVEEALDSVRDAAIINAELAFADLLTVERRIARLKKVSE